MRMGERVVRYEKESFKCADTGLNACEYRNVGGCHDQRYQHEQKDGGIDGQYWDGNESGALYAR